MNQFKDVFLGFDKRPYVRAATAQKCIRAGGKHNDLENVGYTARHHTFFEMLGNFSFGDYFKRDALKYAWELLTEVYKLPADKLWATVYAEDDEAYDIWTKDDRPAGRAHRAHRRQQGRALRLRQLLDDGRHRPLRPVHARSSTTTAPRSPAARRASPEQDGDRYIEIWNNVFMQFNRDDGGRDAQAAQAERRHRHGPGAADRGAAARALQLRDRPVRHAARGGEAGGRRSRREATCDDDSRR